MDKLEEFIRKNRDELDQYNPSPEIWNTISGSVKSKKNRIIWLSSAAMITVILCTSIFFYLGEDRKRILNRDSENLIMNANPELREAEIYYNNMYNNLINEASPFLTGNPELERELISDLTQVDSICSSIKKDLKDNVANQDVIEALLNNYRIKIRVLEDMLDLLKENEETDKKGGTNHAL